MGTQKKKYDSIQLRKKKEKKEDWSPARPLQNIARRQGTDGALDNIQQFRLFTFRFYSKTIIYKQNKIM